MSNSPSRKFIFIRCSQSLDGKSKLRAYHH